MSTITLSLPDNIKDQLKKEPNQSALVSRLLNDHFSKDFADDLSEKDILLQEKELMKKKQASYNYKVEQTLSWILQHYKLSVEEGSKLAKNWVETMWAIKGHFFIRDFINAKGYSNRIKKGGDPNEV